MYQNKLNFAPKTSNIEGLQENNSSPWQFVLLQNHPVHWKICADKK